MLQFEGNSEHSLDPKGRLNIPSRFREVLKDGYDTEMLKVLPRKGILCAYPLPEWDDAMRKLRTDGVRLPKGGELMRNMNRFVVDCPMDKQGRILLPPDLRALAGIDKDVVLAGVSQYFEIWNLAVWQREFENMQASFDDYEEVMAAIGRL